MSKINEDTDGAGVGMPISSTGVAYTNNNALGMGPVVAPQPSAIPGDLSGSTIGSGDVANYLGSTGFNRIEKINKTKSKTKTSLNRFSNSLSNIPKEKKKKKKKNVMNYKDYNDRYNPDKITRINDFK